MASCDIQRLLAVPDGGNAAGIVTSSDIVRWVTRRGGYLRREA
jgi:CBS domain-containing protein